jgi:hypothetical protein
MTVGETFVQSTMMNVPPADEEIEIVQAAQIAVFHGVRRALWSVRRKPPDFRRPLTLALCGNVQRPCFNCFLGWCKSWYAMQGEDSSPHQAA